jgi:hypothetical protein
VAVDAAVDAEVAAALPAVVGAAAVGVEEEAIVGGEADAAGVVLGRALVAADVDSRASVVVLHHSGGSGWLLEVCLAAADVL